MSTTTSEPLAEIQIVDGGAYVHVDGLTVPILSADLEDHDEVTETLDHIERVLHALHAAIPQALADVKDQRAKVGPPCEECGGKGFIDPPDDVRGYRLRARELDCPVCAGSGVAA